MTIATLATVKKGQSLVETSTGKTYTIAGEYCNGRAIAICDATGKEFNISQKWNDSVKNCRVASSFELA